MKYRFKPTQQFWESFYALSSDQKDSTRRAWRIFKENPFDPRLRAHKIHRLSAQYGRTIYAVEIESNLRAVFYIERNVVVTADIGSHDLYRLTRHEVPYAAIVAGGADPGRSTAPLPASTPPATERCSRFQSAAPVSVCVCTSAR